MQRSRFLAGLIGPVLLAMAVSLLINRDLFTAMIEVIGDNIMLIIFAGMITLVAGLAMVQAHNVWRGWPTIITVLGWLAVIGGLARILAPRQIAAIAPNLAVHSSLLMVVAAIAGLLGAFLSYQAFARKN